MRNKTFQSTGKSKISTGR